MDILDLIKNFTKSKFNLALIFCLLILGGFLIFSSPEQQEQPTDKLTINYFFLPSCPHCTEQKPIILELQKEFPDIQFFFHDISLPEGSALFYKKALEAGMNVTMLGTPTTFVGEKPLIGIHTKQQIIDVINECIEQCKNQKEISQKTEDLDSDFTQIELPFLGKTDLTSFSLPFLAITLGLIDGFNPCAMWVLVYLIALLINIGDKRKIWLVVGSFVLASGILYFLFMTAWLNIFLYIGYLKPVTILIGLVALGGGILSLKEYYTSKGNLECKVTDEKEQKKTMGKIEEIISQPISLAVILGVFALAFAVNSVEFVCSAAIPAIFTQILALSDISLLEQYLYILLYVFFFMLDDLLIFGMAAFAVNSGFAEKYARHCKFLGGAILFILGLILLFAPHLLR